MRVPLDWLRDWTAQSRSLLPHLFAEEAPLDLRIVGRMLLHAALVGLAAGLAGAAFFAALESAQRSLLEGVVGYLPLRAHGERLTPVEGASAFRPWLLVLLPALGGVLCGLLTRLAPETRGGGVDATIDAFHRDQGIVRGRVIWVKMLASLATLGTGGAGGREGPTIQIGGALGSYVGGFLGVGARERRILLLAGAAAGISAVFRTPLGAALLAVEVLYRDGFESDALVPAVLASVVSYSVVITIFGESTLFAHAARFPFVPAHLPYYALLALLMALLAAGFATTLHRTRSIFARLPGPEWLRPALGGLALGAFAVPIVVLVGREVHQSGQGIGLLGGGYGAVQVAISGASWLPGGWRAVQLLLLLSLAKLLAASLTVGSQGSAGDFAPSLAIGGLAGGAFGRALALVSGDPRIDPGAFALVGMGAFYGGIAHVPLSALVLVCELAGNYDLLVPLMLAQGIAFVALRRRALYDAQVPTQRDSPVHRDAAMLQALETLYVRDVVKLGRPYLRFRPNTPAREILHEAAGATWQDVFPVEDDGGRTIGLVSASALRVLGAADGDDSRWALAADVMQPAVSVALEDDLRTATQRLLGHGLRELLVLDTEQRTIGFLDEADIAEHYLGAAGRAERARTPIANSTGKSPKRAP
jgi:CIC family chloride channel protein